LLVILVTISMFKLISSSLVAATIADSKFKKHLVGPEDAGIYPVIFFVTGFSGLAPEFSYSDLVGKIVDRGYIVVGLDHIELPDYPSQGKAFFDVMEWAKDGLGPALKDAGIASLPDLDKVAVMGQSAGNHVVGEGLQANGCSLAKAQVMLDPVDGFDPFGIITAQNLITPGQKLTYTTPTLLLDNELDPKAKNILFPACAPANLGAPRWFDAVAGPVFNVNASQYGHVDCLNDAIILAGGLVCPTNLATNKNRYKNHLAKTIHWFLSGVFDGNTENLDLLQDTSSYKIDVTLRQDLKNAAIKPGCTNNAVLV